MDGTTHGGNGPRPPRGSVGEMLKGWREARRLSQLDLSLETGVSTRHISFVETGKARPSRDLIEQLADTLDVPLRDRNALLLAGGFAPRYRQTDLSRPEMANMRHAIDLILAQHEPYPAFVIDRYWDILLANRGAGRVLARVLGREPLHRNVIHQVLDPADMRPHLANWEHVAADLLRHLGRQVLLAPGDGRLRGLLDAARRYPGLPDPRRRDADAGILPTLATRFRSAEGELSFFSTLTQFGAPLDVTLEEVHIECMFPNDPATAALCAAWAAG